MNPINPEGGGWAITGIGRMKRFVLRAFRMCTGVCHA